VSLAGRQVYPDSAFLHSLVLHNHNHSYRIGMQSASTCIALAPLIACSADRLTGQLFSRW
jgi:hypothetical protein